MSIDPAIGSTPTLKNVSPFEKLVINSEEVYVFDFDGVVSSTFEDDIYKLAPKAEETELLDRAAKQFKILCKGMEQQYQRHLIYQAAAWKLKMPIPVGPALASVKEASEHSRLFILSARSGWYATERLRVFLAKEGIFPIEIYNIGRVKKDRQLELLCSEYRARIVHFVEDSAAHLAQASALPLSNLDLVFLKNTCKLQPEELFLRDHFRQTVEKAIRMA
jgi:hypothetical protein